MKHIRRFHEELKPSTYDRIASVSKSRGDSRGNRMAGTAIALKNREFTGKEFSYKVIHSSDIKNSTIKTLDGGSGRLAIHLDDGSSIELDTYDAIGPVGAKGRKFVELVDQNGKLIEVDRKTSNLLVKAFNQYNDILYNSDSDVEIKSGDIPQF